MNDSETLYIALRTSCIDTFKTVCKDSIAFDINEVPQELRVRLLQDPEYIAKTKCYKGLLFKKQLEVLNGVINDEYGDSKKATAPSDIMKAIEMKNKILFSDMNIDADESNALNITMQMYSREEMLKMETVTAATEGSNNASLAEEEPKATEKDPLAAEIEQEWTQNPTAQEKKAAEIDW